MTKITKKIEDMITAWNEADRELAKWKAKEMDLRKELFAVLFPSPTEGSNNKIRVGHGKAIQAKHTINRKIDRAEHDRLRAMDNIAPIVAEVVKYNPELKTTEFKALSDDDKKLIAPMITETPGAPALEIKDENKIRWA